MSGDDAAQAPDRFDRGAASTFLRRVTFIAALGGFLFGYDTGVISSALLYIAPDFHLGDGGKQLVVASLLLGALLGALVSGVTLDRLGRRRSLVIAAAVFAVSAVACAFAPNTAALAGFRFVLGLGLGVSSTAVPTYLSETAPKETRGRLVSINQFLITVGILISYAVDYALAPAHAWRWMLGLAAVPALAMAVGMFTLPETGRWLVGRGRDDEAREVLGRLRSPQKVEEDLRDIHDAIEHETGGSYRDVLTRHWWPSMRIGIGVPFFNQLVGVNAIIYYAPTILKQTGFGNSASILSSVGIGVVNVAFTGFALATIDRLGRRPLVIAGVSVLALALAVLGGLYLLPSQRGAVGFGIIGALCLYIAAFGASLGVAIWLIPTEVFPTEIRAKGTSLATSTHWALDFLISLTVLSLISALGTAGMFFLFCGIAVIAVLFFVKYLPETRGKTLEQVQGQMQPT